MENLICQIQWVDDDGKATPDTNPAIGRCWTVARRTVYEGRYADIPESKHYLICAKHAEQLPMLGNWSFEPLANGSTVDANSPATVSK